MRGWGLVTVPESWNAVVVVLLITACIFAYGVHVLVHPDAGTNPSAKPRGIQPPDAEQTAALRERYSEFGLRVKMCVWLGVSRGLDLAFLNAD